MATSSSWRTTSGNGATRWSQAASNNNNNSQAQGNAAASVPRSAGSMNVNRPNNDRDNDMETIQRDRMMYLLVGLVVSLLC